MQRSQIFHQYINNMSAYTRKIVDIFSSTLIGFALTLAKDVGILQVLLEAKQPMTSQEIADKKELKERYVREILNSLATAEVIHVSTNDEGALVYHIEEDEKQTFKTPVMGFVSFPAMLTTVYDKVKACIPKSGPYGNPYSDVIHDLLAEFGVYYEDKFVDKIINFVEGLKEKLENGIEVIEFGCGKGNLLAKFAQMFPKSTFVASEYVPSLLEKLKAHLGHIPNINYELYDLCSLPEPPAKQYDWIYCVDVIHDLPIPCEALKGIRKLVKEPGGIFTMIDMATSGSPIIDRGNLHVAGLYVTSTFLCIPESFQREDSHALGACWGKQTAIDMATTAGFNVKTFRIENNMALYICKP